MEFDAVNAAVAMVPEQWRTLPAKCIEVIQSKLDYRTLIRSRLVCNSWNTRVTSPGYCPLDPAAKCILMAHNSGNNTLVVHNRSKFFWQSLPCTYLLDSAANLPESEFAAYFQLTWNPTEPYASDIVGTAGGLVCFRTSGFFHPNLIVCNPVLKTFRVLPRMVSNDKILDFQVGYRVCWGLAAMLFDRDTGIYKLVVVGYSDHEDYPSPITLKATQVYDSLTMTWRSTYQQKTILGYWMDFRRSYNKSVLYKGFLFVITLADPWDRGLSVMIFNMEEGSWLKHFVSPITNNWGPVYGSIAVSNDELYMVATDEDSSWSTINYWKLSVPDLPAAWRNESLCGDAGTVWQLVRKISRQSPQFPISTLLWDDTKYWFSMGQNGCFYFMFSIHDDVDFDTVLIHDIAADTWTTLHFEESTGFEDGYSFFDLCVFQPSFAQV